MLYYNELMTVFDGAVVLFFVVVFMSIPLWALYVQDRRPSDLDLLYSYKSSESHVTFPWGRLWVYDSHSGAPSDMPTIVFIHSIGSSIYSWRYQIPELQKNYRVIAFDLLGFGKSDKPLSESYALDGQEARVMALLDHLRIDKCALVGCSLGGAISLWLASRHKERFTHVAVIAPAAVQTLVPFFAPQLQSLSALASRIVSRSVIRIALSNGFAYKKNITPEVIENYFAPFAEPNGVHCFLRTVETIKDARIYNSLPTIRIPTLVLWGKSDRVVLKRTIDQIIKVIPNVKTLIHPTGGHHLMEDEPLWVNENLLAFLDEGRSSL